MAVDIKWLEERVFNARFSDHEAALIDSITTLRRYNKGDTIIEQGQAGGELYLTYRGSVSIARDGVLLASAGEAQLFGEISFLTDEPATATVKAEEDSEIYVMSRSGYAQLMRENPEMVYALFAYILKNTAEIIRKMNADHSVMQNYIMGRPK